MTEEDRKESRKNIIIMVLLCVVFVIGIVLNWKNTKNAIITSVNSYIERIK